jgi:NTE family protein
MSTALVLAGGGLTGIAWEIGVLKGLRANGFDPVSTADVIIGTSAGSTVGAQLSLGRDIDDLHAAQLRDDTNEISPHIDLELLGKVYELMPGGGSADDDVRRKIGALALGADTVDWPTRRRVIEGRIGTETWPGRRLVVTAIDAESGAFRTWTKEDGVGLIDAVASSCAVAGVWPCVPVNGRKYYDGGFRNSANAFLAAGHDDIWVLAPLTGLAAPAVDAEIAELRAGGANVRFITADDEATAAMGPNSLDPRRRGVAAENGLRQGLAWRAS